MIQGFSGGLLNRQLIYNLDLPSFQRDFASLKTLDHGTGPAITFTRASNATYFDANGVLQTAANDVPRFDHDPATGASRGLLIEESRTNLLERSAEFDDAYWSTIDATVVANAATSPASTLTADRVHPSGNSAASVFFRNVSASASTAYSASVFVKAAGKTFGFLQINFNQSSTPIRAFAFTIDLSNGTLGTQQDLVSTTTGVTAAATSVGSGWYRIAMSFTTTALTDEVAFLAGPCNAANSRTVTANGTDGIFAWGAQLEAGAFPTSYIPTTSAAATRSADSAVVTPISSFYNQAEGTIFSDTRRVAEGSGGFPAPLRFFQTTDDTKYLQHWVASNGTSAAFKISGGANGAEVSRSGLTANQPVLICGSYAENNVIASINGTLTAQDTSVNIPSTIDRLQIGTYGPFAQFTNGHIRKIAYYPKRLSDALLQQLTT
jgi:hypothetical protein